MTRFFVCLLLVTGLWGQIGRPVHAQPIVEYRVNAATLEQETSPEKNPWLAAGLSLVAPGMGQVYVEESWWPGVPILGGLLIGAVTYFWADHQRDASIRVRNIRGQDMRLADAGWDMLVLILQIALPSLWIWNFADAYRRAEIYNQKVTDDLEGRAESAIIKGRFLLVTWKF